MGHLSGRQSVRDFLVGLSLLCSAAALVIYPQQAMTAMKSGMTLCGNVIIPALFPFLVLSSMVVELGMSGYIGRLLEPIMVPLFRINGSCAAALALGFLGGYPVGARTAIGLYQSGQCSRTEAERLLAFCNNCGPAFILGVVGAGIFGNSKIGFLLYLAHILASVTVGLLFRWYKPKEGPHRTKRQFTDFHAVSIPFVLTQSITSALQSALNICAFILFFTVALQMLSVSGIMHHMADCFAILLSPLGLDQTDAYHLLIGLLEMSSGVASLTDGTLTTRLPMAAFMLGWAGVSIHCQVMTFLTDSGLSPGTYLFGKLLHGILSAVFMALFGGLLPLEYPVSYYLAEQTSTITYLEFQQTLAISAAAAWLILLLFFLLTNYAIKKSSRNRYRSIL